jgi:polyisoprenoid-binding protein YceI
MRREAGLLTRAGRVAAPRGLGIRAMKKSSLTLFSILALGVAPALPAAATDYVPDPSHVSIHFTVSHRDISYVSGRFDKVTVTTLQFDPAAKTGFTVVIVDPDSIDTGNRAIDTVLRSDQFLDSAAFPEIRFAGERFVFDGDRPTAVDGRLWLHGVERPLRLTVERFVCKDVALGIVTRRVCGGAFRASFRRSDFGMTRFLPDVGDEVRLDIGVEASPR